MVTAWRSTKTAEAPYRISLEQAQYASSVINLSLAAIRQLAYGAAERGLLSPDLAAGIRRVKGVKEHGMRIGNCLTTDQGKRPPPAFGGEDLRSKRDYVMVALLLGCGLRKEVAGLAVEHLQALGDRGPHRQGCSRLNRSRPDCPLVFPVKQV
jgi:hypothetical protein